MGGQLSEGWGNGQTLMGQRLDAVRLAKRTVLHDNGPNASEPGGSGRGVHLTKPPRRRASSLVDEPIAMRASTSSLRPEVAPAGTGQPAGRRALHPARRPSRRTRRRRPAGEATTDTGHRPHRPHRAAVACAASWLVIAAFQREPSVAAEARYLGLVTAAVLLAALQAAPRIGTMLGTAIVLLGAIPWALPGTPDRGVAVGVLLAAILAIAAAGRVLAPRSPSVRTRAALAWPPSRISRW